MKPSKLFVFICLTTFFTITLISCKRCRHEDPRARIINNSTQTVSVQVKTSGGNTVNLNNVNPGETSSYASYAPGIITFTVKVNGVDYVKTVQMDECFDYDISIDSNNTITSLAIDRNK
jgi:hypothetical protein